MATSPSLHGHDASRPRKGDPVHYRSKPVGAVVRVDGRICWTDYHDDRGEQHAFIWCFHDGLNTLHDWPTKGGVVRPDPPTPTPCEDAT